MCTYYADSVKSCFTSTKTITGDTTISNPEPISHVMSGTVRAADGTKLPGYDVSLWQYSELAVTTSTSDSSGSFSMPMAAGVYSRTGVSSYSSPVTPVAADGTPYAHSAFGYNTITIGAKDSPSTDLTNSDVTDNFVIPFVKIHVLVEDGSGNLMPNASVWGTHYEAGDAQVSLNGTTIPMYEDAVIFNSSMTSQPMNGTYDVNVPQGIHLYPQNGSHYDQGFCTSYVDSSKACYADALSTKSPVTVLFKEGSTPVSTASLENLTANSPTSSPSLTWTTSTGASSYNVYRDGTLIASPTTNSYVDQSAADGQHQYTVSVNNLLGEGLKSSAILITVDKSGPTITSSQNIQPNSNGWYNANLTLSFSCADAGSGIATYPGPQTVTSEGQNQQVSVSANDNVGNASTLTIPNISIDKTAPTITASGSTPPNANGWNNGTVTITFKCSDALSGVASCSSPATLSAEGKNQSASGTVVDKAGNGSSVTVSNVNIDKTKPTLTNTTITSTTVHKNDTVYVGANSTDALSGVQNGEYYFDTDPGVGKAKPLTYDSKNNAVYSSVQISGLSKGNHTLYVRAQDNAGNWSNVGFATFKYVN